MFNFPGKRIAVKLVNRLEEVKKKEKAKRLYEDFDSEILDLYFQSFGIAAPLSLLSFLNQLLNIWKPNFVIEFGSGVSTLILAKNIQDTNGKIITLDESSSYLERSRQNIIKKYKADNIKFIHPIEEGKINYQALQQGKELPFKIDLVLIDGPTGERFTSKAKKIYEKIISSNTICFIDDTDREINNFEAKRIASQKTLIKIDFRDDIYSPKHKWSILYPPFMQEIIQKIPYFEELKIS